MNRFQIGMVVRSLNNPELYGTVEYSSFGFSIHFWTKDEEGNRVLGKTLGDSERNLKNYWELAELPKGAHINENGGVIHG